MSLYCDDGALCLGGSEMSVEDEDGLEQKDRCRPAKSRGLFIHKNTSIP